MGHPTMQENDTAKLTPTLYISAIKRSISKNKTIFVKSIKFKSHEKYFFNNWNITVF